MSDLQWVNIQELRAHPRPDVLYCVSVKFEFRTAGSSPIYYTYRRLADGGQEELGTHKTIEKAYEACQEDFNQLPPMEEGPPREPLPPKPPRVE